MPNGQLTDFGESVDYLSSVSDVMAGLLFVFILVLIVFAIQFKGQTASLAETERHRSRIIEELTQNNELRRELLSQISEALRERGVIVQVDLERGILRLPESILFPLGSAKLEPAGVRAIRILGEELSKVLPCFSKNPPESVSGCRVEQAGKVEAVFVEGHTDNIPIGYMSAYPDNWSLSSARAIATFQTLVQFQPVLDELRNSHEVPLFGVAGYADRRPVASNNDENDRRLNRRIDLRFIMTSPEAPGEEEKR